MSEIVHIAGPDVQVESRLRQRCAWCGATLVDYDLECVAVPLSRRDPRPAMWPTGELVAVDGPVKRTVEHTGNAPLPAEACTRLDPEVTR